MMYRQRDVRVVNGFADSMIRDITNYRISYAESGTVSAEYEYDPFGKVTSHTGMDFDFQFSTKFYDPDIGMYYYGYRYYSPELRRWASRDPIGEEGGLNLYGFCGNDGVNSIDILGEWSATRESYGKRRRVYKKEKNDKFPELARIVGLDVEEINYWAKFVDGPHGNRELFGWEANSCYVSVSNIVSVADLLRGGSWYYHRLIVNNGGSIGSFFSTITSPGHHVVHPETYNALLLTLKNNKGNIMEMVVYAHGHKNGFVGSRDDAENISSLSDAQNRISRNRHNQMHLINAVKSGGYKIRQVKMRQCYSMNSSSYYAEVVQSGGRLSTFSDGSSLMIKPRSVNWYAEWQSVSVLPPKGYQGINIMGFIDWED